MSFFKDIKNQSQATREIMFGFSVIIAVSLAGVVWFNSFQKNMYVMLNPDKETEQKFFAGGNPKFANLYDEKKTTDIPSLFSNIGQAGKDLKAAVLNILNVKDNNEEVTPQAASEAKETINAKAYLLPLAGVKNQKK